MEAIPCKSRQTLHEPSGSELEPASPFSREWVTISKEERIALTHRANYWEAQSAQLKQKFDRVEAESQRQDAKIKDLQNRLFGKKSERPGSTESEKGDTPTAKPQRGQPPGGAGHGRTQRPDLPVVSEVHDLPEDKQQCPICCLPYLPKPGLDQHNECIEVEVKAHTRRIHRPAYVRNPGCHCPGTPAVITLPPPSRLIPRSPSQVRFWVEVLLSKYRYAQPTHRYLQDRSDRALPISPGTVAGGLQAIAPLFEPIMEGLYQKQMTETLFHHDEPRWEVLVELADQVGTRWYRWVTRSQSVVFFVLDPSRSAAVPGAPFAGLQQERVIIVCDRYSAYKKLARLSGGVLLAFCWAHVRRDFLNAGRGYKELEAWALEWKEPIGALYHHNRLRLAHWDRERPLDQQTEALKQHHQKGGELRHKIHQQATGLTGEEDSLDEQSRSLSKSARKQQRKVCQSLLDHWSGLWTPHRCLWPII
jgi:transposase